MALELKYFVLNPRSKEHGDKYAAASRKAMRVYAGMIYSTDPGLAESLCEWADRESKKDIDMMPDED